jgi:hypothetical protein
LHPYLSENTTMYSESHPSEAGRKVSNYYEEKSQDTKSCLVCWFANCPDNTRCVACEAPLNLQICRKCEVPNEADATVCVACCCTLRLVGVPPGSLWCCKVCATENAAHLGACSLCGRLASSDSIILESKQAEFGPQISCPWCGARSPDASDICSRCHKPLDVVLCPNRYCRQASPLTAPFCAWCGASLDGGARDSVPTVVCACGFPNEAGRVQCIACLGNVDGGSSLPLHHYSCPNPSCGCLIFIAPGEENCRIVRCGVDRTTGAQIGQHLSEEAASALVASGAIRGCGKQARLAAGSGPTRLEACTGL